jgi:hypothetical protein
VAGGDDTTRPGLKVVLMRKHILRIYNLPSHTEIIANVFAR